MMGKKHKGQLDNKRLWFSARCCLKLTYLKSLYIDCWHPFCLLVIGPCLCLRLYFRMRNKLCTSRVAMLAVEVWKCQWGPVPKDRENAEINVSRPAVWKDIHFWSHRDHVATDQNVHSLYAWYLKGFEQKWMNLNPLFLIHFRFSKTCPTLIFYWYLQCFFNVLISDVWKHSRGFRSAGKFLVLDLPMFQTSTNSPSKINDCTGPQTPNGRPKRSASALSRLVILQFLWGKKHESTKKSIKRYQHQYFKLHMFGYNMGTIVASKTIDVFKSTCCASLRAKKLFAQN